MGNAWLLAAEMPFSAVGQDSGTRSLPILWKNDSATNRDNGLSKAPGPCYALAKALVPGKREQGQQAAIRSSGTS